MTLAELGSLFEEKMYEQNPLKLPDRPEVIHVKSNEDLLERFDEVVEITNEIDDQNRANSNYRGMVAKLFQEVYRTLYEELGLSREEVDELPPTTQLPPRTSLLAEKARVFPDELQ